MTCDDFDPCPVPADEGLYEIPDIPEDTAGIRCLVYPFKRDSTCAEIREQSPFDSITASCWWALVTMTTLGYGDVSPSTPVGKCISMFVMILGILVIALPITLVGTNFSYVYAKLHRRRGAGDEDEDEEEDDDDADNSLDEFVVKKGDYSSHYDDPLFDSDSRGRDATFLGPHPWMDPDVYSGG
eukprot:scaffold94_cov340-Prasinococcus_capsulatus_cf.AAC.7